MKKENGITLIALIITIIILLLLAGIALNVIVSDNIFGIAGISVEEFRKSQIKEKIELSIMDTRLEKKREITLDEIIDGLIDKGITTEMGSDRDSGTVITEEGYLATIIEKEEGGWEVIIGEKDSKKTALTCTVIPTQLTSKVTVKIEGMILGEGIKELVLPNGEIKTYESGTKKISEEYEISKNDTYTVKLIGNNKTELEETINVNNIVEGIITIIPSTTEASKTVTIEVSYPEGSESLIKEISIDNGNSWKEYTGPIEITENTTIKAVLRSETETIKQASLTINNIDTTAPTAPVITGGSTEYRESVTISVSTEPIETGSGIAYYEYYLTDSSTVPTTSTIATGKVGTTASENSKVFNTNYTGYYVYFRAIDNATNIGEWSNYQRIYIDVNEPTVTVTNESVTITVGDSNAISGYFTTNQNGNASITSTTYKEGSTTISNTSTLSVGTHTITCTVTKATGLSATATITIIVKDIEYAKVSYTTPGTYTWTVPIGVTRVKATVAGAGGGGSGSARKAGDKQSAGGAGGNGASVEQYIDVSPGEVYTIIVGAGGKGSPCNPAGGGNTGADRDSTPGGAGGSSSAFGVSADGGGGGTKAHSVKYGAYNGSTGTTAGNGKGGTGGAGGAAYSTSPSGIWDGKDGGNGWVYIEYGTSV